MSEAQEALADVRGWLCDNLSDGDAGEVCGMLSVVSRHINELETENIELQATKSYLLMNSNPTTGELRRVSIEWKKDRDENAKLRELLSEVAKPLTNPEGGCLKPGCALGCPHHLECDEELGTCFYVDRMRELGIEVDE